MTTKAIKKMRRGPPQPLRHSEVPEEAYEHGESTIEAADTFDESCTQSFYRQERR